MKKISLTTWIFIALVGGVVAGFIFKENIAPFGIIGDLWLNLIKLIVIPLVLFVIMKTIGDTGSNSNLGKIASLAIPYFVATTVLASVIGSTLGILARPGEGFRIEQTQAEAPPPVTVTSFFSNLVSDNIFASMAKGNVVQVLIIAILLGLAVRLIPDSKIRTGVVQGINGITELIFSYVKIVISISPIGIFFLMATTIGKNGANVLGPFAGLIGLFYLGVAIQILFVYGSAAWAFGRVNPLRFLQLSSRLWTFTASTASSSAAIPVSLDVAEKKFGVSQPVRSFVIPLGSQVNHDGNALLLPLLAVFAGQAVGINFSFLELIQIVLLGTMLSFGGGGIPGSGIVKVLIVMQVFGLPLEVGAMAAGFYRLFDMGITTANCLGDLAGALAIDRLIGRKRAAQTANPSAKPIEPEEPVRQ